MAIYLGRFTKFGRTECFPEALFFVLQANAHNITKFVLNSLFLLMTGASHLPGGRMGANEYV